MWVLSGGVIVGALGTRAATLQIVGDWRDIGPDLEMESLSMAGVIVRAGQPKVSNEEIRERIKRFYFF